MAAKLNGSAARCPARFSEIHLPSNTPAEFMLGGTLWIMFDLHGRMMM